MTARAGDALSHATIFSARQTPFLTSDSAHRRIRGADIAGNTSRSAEPHSFRPHLHGGHERTPEPSMADSLHLQHYLHTTSRIATMTLFISNTKY